MEYLGLLFKDILIIKKYEFQLPPLFSSSFLFLFFYLLINVYNSTCVLVTIVDINNSNRMDSVLLSNTLVKKGHIKQIII